MADKQQIRIKVMVDVCVPLARHIPSEWLISFLEFIHKDQNRYDLNIQLDDSSPIDKSRNRLVKKALEGGAEFIFFIDADNVIHPGALDKLMKVMVEQEADLVTGLYFQKNKPYSPVIRKYEYGGYWNIDVVPQNKVIPIDGAGMGCCLIRAKAIKDLEYPYFKYSYENWEGREIQLAEDLYFCRELMRKGKKMLCHTGVIAPHIGGTIDENEYLNFEPVMQAVEGEKKVLLQHLCEFIPIPMEALVHKVSQGEKLLRQEWNEKNPKTWGQMLEFYKNTENYLYDLTHWHLTQRRAFDLSTEAKVMAVKPKNVLDFGCGIGQNAIMLARKGVDVTLADVGSKTLNFAKYRFQQEGLPFKEWITDGPDMPPDEKYDAIIILDVFEHLPKDMLKFYVEKLVKLKHKDTKIITAIAYGKTPDHPMHHDIDEDTIKIIERLIKEF